MQNRNLDIAEAEVTKEEWASRKLTSYGYFSALIDVAQLFLYFAGVGAISYYMAPYAIGNQIYFWDILETIFFISAMKGLFKVTDPINSFQTIIRKK